jgi:hypothetical protein
MSYSVAAFLAIPITMFGIIGVVEARQKVRRIMESFHERRLAEMADIGAAPVPNFQDELRFTQSLLALSKVRSQERDDSREPAPDESSSLVLVHRAQSRIPDRAA